MISEIDFGRVTMPILLEVQELNSSSLLLLITIDSVFLDLRQLPRRPPDRIQGYLEEWLKDVV